MRGKEGRPLSLSVCCCVRVVKSKWGHTGISFSNSCHSFSQKSFTQIINTFTTQPPPSDIAKAQVA